MLTNKMVSQAAAIAWHVGLAWRQRSVFAVHMHVAVRCQVGSSLRQPRACSLKASMMSTTFWLVDSTPSSSPPSADGLAPMSMSTSPFSIHCVPVKGGDSQRVYSDLSGTADNARALHCRN